MWAVRQVTQQQAFLQVLLFLPVSIIALSTYLFIRLCYRFLSVDSVVKQNTPVSVLYLYYCSVTCVLHIGAMCLFYTGVTSAPLSSGCL